MHEAGMLPVHKDVWHFKFKHREGKAEYSISQHLRKYLQENHMNKQRKTGLGIEASHFKIGSHPKGLD